jgi:hypothetical protein
MPAGAIIARPATAAFSPATFKASSRLPEPCTPTAMPVRASVRGERIDRQRLRESGIARRGVMRLRS